MKNITTLVLAALLTGATLSAGKPPPTEIEFYKRLGKGVVPAEKGGPFVRYLPPGEWGINPDGKVPGGAISFETREKTEAAARVQNCTVQVTDKNGKELVRFRPEPPKEDEADPVETEILKPDNKGEPKWVKDNTRVKSGPRRDGTAELPWMEFAAFDIPVAWSGTLTVKIYNAHTKKTWAYTIKEAK
jgi:hypothetical protein